MAISYVKVDYGSFGGSSLTDTITGIQSGDLVVLGFSCSSSRTITSYDGWTEIYNITNSGDSSYPSQSFLLYKLASSTSISFDITFDSTAYGVWGALVVRGSTDITSSSNNIETAGTTFPSTAINGIGSSAISLYFAFGYDASTTPGTWTVPSGYTLANGVGYVFVSGHQRYVYMAYKTSPASTEAPSASNSQTWDGRTMYLVIVGDMGGGGSFLGFSF